MGSEPLATLTSPLSNITKSKNPLDGATQSVDGAAGSLDGAARVLPQGSFRNGLPLGDVSDAAGVEPRTNGAANGLTGTTTPPMDLSLLDGREVVGVSHGDEPVPGMFSSLSGRVDSALNAPAMSPLTDAAVPQLTDHVSNGTDHVGTMADVITEELDGFSAHEALSGPADAVRGTMPEAARMELAPVLGTVSDKMPMRSRGGSPVDEVAPLVDDPSAAAGALVGNGNPLVNDTVGSLGQSTSAVTKLAPLG